MISAYLLLKPYITDNSTFRDVLSRMFTADVEQMNRLYKIVTRKSADDVAGVDVVMGIVYSLEHNEFGAFLDSVKVRE